MAELICGEMVITRNESLSLLWQCTRSFYMPTPKLRHLNDATGTRGIYPVPNTHLLPWVRSRKGCGHKITRFSRHPGKW